jgi:hypothetical protein
MQENKVSIRPIIKGISNSEMTTEFEKFQNATLRPIVKMQHELFVLSFENYLLTKKLNLKEISKIDLLNRIDSSLTKDISYKNCIVGFVLGQFTENEFLFYLKNKSEIHKRIISIVKKRLKDTFT